MERIHRSILFYCHKICSGSFSRLQIALQQRELPGRAVAPGKDHIGPAFSQLIVLLLFFSLSLPEALLRSAASTALPNNPRTSISRPQPSKASSKGVLLQA